MTDYTVFDMDGRIIRSGRAPNEAAAKAQGINVLIGARGDDRTQSVAGGRLVTRPPEQPSPDELKAEADRRARARRRALMPMDELVATFIDAIDDPDGPSRQKIDQWKADIAAIEADRKAEHDAIDAQQE